MKISWQGDILSVQPRIRMTRSWDERNHGYQGFVLNLSGIAAGEKRDFVVAIGPGAQEKHAFRAGDHASGEAEPVADPRLEAAHYYKASRLKVLIRDPSPAPAPPPWRGVPPPLPVYRDRGHRRLDARTHGAGCRGCIWACRMPVEIILDAWKPEVRQHRFESFCYGPKSCPVYRPGPPRRVPGRGGESWLEEDWVDEDLTAHRGPDD